MSGFTIYGMSELVDGTAMPTTLYAKLHTGNPSSAGTSHPSSETTRKEVVLVDGTSTLQKVNDAPIEWLTLPANETITHFTLWDASTGGNPWFVGEWDPAADVVIGGDLQILVNKIVMNFPVHS